jgi:hypothetical protein
MNTLGKQTKGIILNAWLIRGIILKVHFNLILITKNIV